MHVDLIGPYIKSLRQHHQFGDIIKKNFSLTYVTMIYPATGWFEIVEVPKFDLDEVMGGNYYYMDNYFARVSQLFNDT